MEWILFALFIIGIAKKLLFLDLRKAKNHFNKVSSYLKM